jgi:hypothetical protein
MAAIYIKVFLLNFLSQCNSLSVKEQVEGNLRKEVLKLAVELGLKSLETIMSQLKISEWTLQTAVV